MYIEALEHGSARSRFTAHVVAGGLLALIIAAPLIALAVRILA